MERRSQVELVANLVDAHSAIREVLENLIRAEDQANQFINAGEIGRAAGHMMGAASVARIFLRAELKASGAWTPEDEERLSK